MVVIFCFPLYFFVKKNVNKIQNLLDIFHDLDDILVMKNMIFADALWLVFHRGPPDKSMLEPKQNFCFTKLKL